MVESFNPPLGKRPVVCHAGGWVRHAILGDHPGIVDLEEEPGVHDGPIFLPHGLGDGEEVGLVRRVERVPGLQLDRAGRHRRDERLLDGYPGQCSFEGIDVALDRGLPLIGNGAGAHDGYPAALPVARS
jgi:hypothetical protein